MFHPLEPHKDLAPRAPIQLPLLFIYKTDLLAKVVLWFNVITDFMYNIDTILCGLSLLLVLRPLL